MSNKNEARETSTVVFQNAECRVTLCEGTYFIERSDTDQLGAKFWRKIHRVDGCDRGVVGLDYADTHLEGQDRDETIVELVLGLMAQELIAYNSRIGEFWQPVKLSPEPTVGILSPDTWDSIQAAAAKAEPERRPGIITFENEWRVPVLSISHWSKSQGRSDQTRVSLDTGAVVYWAGSIDEFEDAYAEALRQEAAFE